MLCIIISRVSS